MIKQWTNPFVLAKIAVFHPLEMLATLEDDAPHHSERGSCEVVGSGPSGICKISSGI